MNQRIPGQFAWAVWDTKEGLFWSAFGIAALCLMLLFRFKGGETTLESQKALTLLYFAPSVVLGIIWQMSPGKSFWEAYDPTLGENLLIGWTAVILLCLATLPACFSLLVGEVVVWIVSWQYSIR